MLLESAGYRHMARDTKHGDQGMRVGKSHAKGKKDLSSMFMAFQVPPTQPSPKQIMRSLKNMSLQITLKLSFSWPLSVEECKNYPPLRTYNDTHPAWFKNIPQSITTKGLKSTHPSTLPIVFQLSKFRVNSLHC